MPADLPVVWSADAERDLFEIWDYLALEASPNVADKRLRDIHRTVANLADWPRLGRERTDVRSGLRSLADPPHVIFYRVEAARVEILRILHGHRDIIRIFSKDTG